METINRTPKWHDGYSFRLSSGCDEEALRIIANSPRWKPAKQRGRPVRQRMVLPFIFQMQ